MERYGVENTFGILVYLQFNAASFSRFRLVSRERARL